jgi:hypothetical protein
MNQTFRFFWRWTKYYVRGEVRHDDKSEEGRCRGHVIRSPRTPTGTVRTCESQASGHVGPHIQVPRKMKVDPYPRPECTNLTPDWIVIPNSRGVVAAACCGDVVVQPSGQGSHR